MKSDDKLMLIRVDPLSIAKSFIDNDVEADRALQLLSSAYTSNMFATLAYNNAIKHGSVFHPEVKNNLHNYFYSTYPVNNSDVSNNWLMKLSGCTNNVEKNIPVIIAAFSLTSILAGPYLASAAVAGSAGAFCYSGYKDTYDNILDNSVKITGDTYSSGSISRVCDMKGNCWNFDK